jgi:NADPH:quinone reductase-like Zn-dependent oxidoreductase
MLSGMLLSPFVSQKIGPCNAKASAEDLDTLRTMIESGEIHPVVERTFTMDEIPVAMRLIETAHVRGKLAITMRPDSERSDRARELELARR